MSRKVVRRSATKARVIKVGSEKLTATSPCRTVKDSRRLSSHVVRALARYYGPVDLGNKRDPLDELIFIVLSQMTTSSSYVRVFDRLKDAFPTWDLLATVRLSRLRRLIKDAGLSNQKAPRIRAIVQRLIDDFGAATLDPLRTSDDSTAESYLASLPGVGIKTAKCVLMYSLRRQVLPIDTHVARVANRLGLLGRPRTDENSHRELERVVAGAMRYDFHVFAVVHGRTLCKFARPKCDYCPIVTVCNYPTNRR